MGTNINDLLAEHGVAVSEDELAHIGVKGMRWGKRKKKSSSDSSSPKGDAKKSDTKDDDAPKKDNGKSDKTPEPKDDGPPKPKISELSDAELKSKINRLKMEQEYARLTAPEVSLGKKVVTEILMEVGKQQAKNLLTREAEKMLTGSARRSVVGAARSAARTNAIMSPANLGPTATRAI